MPALPARASIRERALTTLFKSHKRTLAQFATGPH
jgi:hypothetical protein